MAGSRANLSPLDVAFVTSCWVLAIYRKLRAVILFDLPSSIPYKIERGLMDVRFRFRQEISITNIH